MSQNHKSMRKLFISFLCFVMLSCFKTDIVQYGSKNLDPATFASGQQLTAQVILDFVIQEVWVERAASF